MKIQTGDRLLAKKIKGFNWIQELICWKTNSKFSHIELILNQFGESIDAKFPKIIRSNIKTFFNGNYRVVIIRPTFEINSNFSMTALNLIGKKYDWFNYCGFASNKPMNDKGKFQCAEVNLIADHSMGQFLKENGMMVSPQTYWDYTVAGKFEVIWQKDCPNLTDYKNLLMEV